MSGRRAAGRRPIGADRGGQGRSPPGLLADRQPGVRVDRSGQVQAQRHVQVGEPTGPDRALRSVEHPQLRPDLERHPGAGRVVPAATARLPERGALGPAGRRRQPGRLSPGAGPGGSAGQERDVGQERGRYRRAPVPGRHHGLHHRLDRPAGAPEPAGHPGHHPRQHLHEPRRHYRALGGGWEIREGQDLVPPEIRAEMQRRTNWGDLLAPSTYNLPASREPRSTPRAPDW